MSEPFRPILLVNSGGEAAVADWRAAFAICAPHLDVRWWNAPDVDPAEVHYVLVWQPEAGRIAGYPNLRLILSSAAGVTHITDDPTLPRHLPILRATTDDAAQRMGEYVSLAALGLLRDLPRLIAQQQARHWELPACGRSAAETTVGILGLGNLGQRCAQMLLGLGFRVCGWSRTPKQLAQVDCRHGEAGLVDVAAQSHILVCLLPATPQTDGLLNAELFARMPRGAGVINVGRASHIVRADLLAALDDGQLAGAVLDVFEQEPLPADDRCWSHPRILVTPHTAAVASRRARVEFFARQIQAELDGLPLQGRYDPEQGY
jgi:glyoxylate/hydroxypyruvate reductase A